MSLHQMLTDRRTEILQKCRGKMADVVGSRSSTYQLDEGLPILYDEMMEVLRISLDDDSPETRSRFVSDTITASASRHHAQESYRLGYTVSQLVHGYGCICQGITEYAHESKVPITSAEFGQLNLCLDVAIAQAVSEFENLSLDCANRSESLRIGFLAHELRNYLSSAIMAHELISKGGVGAAGATSSVLTLAHHRMKDIIDRAVVEVRMGGEPMVELERVSVVKLIGEVESSALPEANAKTVSLRVDVDPVLTINADHHLMASALANLVQNAIKFTKDKSNVLIRGYNESDMAVIEVEDSCGGLPEGRIEQIFSPYDITTQEEPRRGLGISIALRAVELNGGKLSAVNIPGVGCKFTIRMKAVTPDTERPAKALRGPSDV